MTLFRIRQAIMKWSGKMFQSGISTRQGAGLDWRSAIKGAHLEFATRYQARKRENWSLGMENDCVGLPNAAR